MKQARSKKDPGLVTGTAWTRREMLAGSLSLLAAGRAAAAPDHQHDFSAQMKALQDRIGGRLGVHVLDTGARAEFSFNDQERFAMCSTFKLALAAAVLARADAGMLSLDRRIAFGPKDMLSHSPVTSAHLGEGSMSVRDLCAAVVEESDNPAANLLLGLIEGPPGLTRFFRSLADEVTRLDRRELELNTNLPGDQRDTTTPRAMVQTMEKVLTGGVLSAASRTQLIAWLVNSRTGLRRIRAGLPATWRAGDKTGTGARGAVNDVVIAWPQERAPIIAAVYMSDSPSPMRELEQAHAQIGSLIATTCVQVGQ